MKVGGCMNYAEILKKYIKESKMTLDEISEEIEKRGLTATKQYLSKLQNGKTPPASEKMNKVLAEVTGGDEDKLNWYAYVEKAPEGFKDIMYAIGDDLVPIGKKLNDKFPGFLEGKYYKSFIEQQPEYVEFQEALKNGLVNLSKGPGGFSFTLEGKVAENLNRKIQENYVEEDGVLYNKNEMIKVKNTLKVPVLGKIAAGSPIFAEEHILDYEEIVNPGNVKDGEIFMLLVKGDSMIGSRIYDGDKVLVKVQPDVENGEIAVVNVNGYEATLKKVKKMPNGQVLLMPSNDKYEPILIDNEKARIIGKVIQVIFEP